MALTPMMQQYLETKEKVKDCILFFRLGDFYEMFFEDAQTASRELELVLTGRDCGLPERAPMCGLPYHAADSYIARLIEKGYKVAICEQLEDPALAKGIVKRDIIRIVTPGTIIESSMLDEKKNNYICSLYIYKKGFSAAFCDISTGEFFVSESSGSYGRALDEISKFGAAELILLSEVDGRDKFVKEVKGKFNILVNIVETAATPSEDFINKFSKNTEGMSKEETIISSILYSYISDTQKSSLSHILQLERYNIEDSMLIDINSRRNLELTETIRNKTKKGSLLWLLDKTKTSMGGRLLRRWIEEPLLDEERINKRLDAVEEFVNNIYVSSDLKEFLRSVYDMERLIGRISCGAANGRDLIALKESIRCLPDIKAVLSNCNAPLLKDYHSDFDILQDVFELIDKAIFDNPPVTIKEGELIKDGYNENIDKYREAMHNGKKWIAELEQKERELTGIKSLKVSYNRVFGYYIEITKANMANVPEDRYMRKQTLANSERFITPELKEVEELILGAEQKLVDLEYSIFTDVRDKVSGEAVRVQNTSSIIASIDALLSLSSVAAENNFVRPAVTDSRKIDIKNGRHPVVEKVIQGIFVPNDTVIDNYNEMIAIITGPNMAGKSTYMRQVALITIMAQIGSFVPAESAEIGIVDRIFTRIGASDDLSSGQSTFMVEMSEVSYILKNATEKSLIILDEVGRGTSTFDGLSIAWAVVQYISEHIKAKTLFATHYHELTELEGKLKGIKNYCISVKEHGEDIIFLRKIILGGADQSYGIQVAKLSGLPDEVVSTAKLILSKLDESDINKNLSKKLGSTEIKHDKKETVNLNQIDLFNYKEKEIFEEISEIDVMNLTPLEAINKLNELIQKVKKFRS